MFEIDIVKISLGEQPDEHIAVGLTAQTAVLLRGQDHGLLPTIHRDVLGAGLAREPHHLAETRLGILELPCARGLGGSATSAGGLLMISITNLVIVTRV